MTSFIHEINNNKNTNFIILSAGENKTRGRHDAKSLTYIDEGKTLLDLQIDIIKKYSDKSKITLAVGYKSKQVIKFSLEKYPEVKIIENKSYRNTTPLESLRLCLNCCSNNDTYVIYGDKYFEADCINIKDRSSPAILESISDSKMKLDLGLIYQNSTLKRLSYGTKKKWGQIFYIPKDLFYDFRHKANNCNKKYYNIFDIINEIAQTYQFKIHKSKNIKELL